MGAENPFAGQGSVLLDIGGEVGALVVTMPDGMDGAEVEIRSAGGRPAPHAHHDPHGHDHHPHVAVVRRPTAAARVPSLVFPEVVEGTYELLLKETDEVRLTVRVVGGRVAEAVWPG
ncbi:MAG: hypothetical protein ACXVXE_08830 [Nocardioidaceae bacterium]